MASKSRECFPGLRLPRRFSSAAEFPSCWTRYHRNSLPSPITQVLQLALKAHDSLPIGTVIAEPGRYNVEIEALERNRQDDKINWITAIFMGAFHVGAIAALFFFTWKAFFVACFLWWVSGSLGIGMSYHRLLTHRGYKTPKWVEYFLTVCATLALEGEIGRAHV